MPKTSDVFTVSKALMTKGGVYYGMTVLGRANGLNQVSIHNSATTNAGQIVDEAIVVSGASYHSNFDAGIIITSGLYAQVTGALRAIVWYQENALQGN
jgi:hypothetical protein